MSEPQDLTKAEVLAERRGCNDINPCWDECVKAALHTIMEEKENAMSVAARIYHEVSSWASKKRDGLIVAPIVYHRREEVAAWREGYYTAMNEVAQHFNMERLKYERGDK